MRKGNERGPANPARSLLRGAGAVLLVAALLSAARPGACAQSVRGQSLIGRRAPEFVRPDLNGQTLDLKRFRGKVVLLNFWATWCAPCQAEMPIFSEWQSKYGPKGFEAIGISMDDDAPPARKLVSRMNLAYPVAMGDARLGRRYGGVLGLPLSFAIDRNGVVRARFQGETDLNVMEKEIRTLLESR